MYRARRTLVVKFDNDAIDESEDVREVYTLIQCTTLHTTLACKVIVCVCVCVFSHCACTSSYTVAQALLMAVSTVRKHVWYCLRIRAAHASFGRFLECRLELALYKTLLLIRSCTYTKGFACALTAVTTATHQVIQAGKTLLRMRRPMVDMDLRYEKLTGTHITPLTQVHKTTAVQCTAYNQ
jgi:hypothetical protein